VYLETRCIKQEAEERQERERLRRLESLWAAVSPAVTMALELVNAKLAPHRMRLFLSNPGFFGSTEAPDGYGVVCQLHSNNQWLTMENSISW